MAWGEYLALLNKMHLRSETENSCSEAGFKEPRLLQALRLPSSVPAPAACSAPLALHGVAAGLCEILDNEAHFHAAHLPASAGLREAGVHTQGKDLMAAPCKPQAVPSPKP